MVSDDRKLYGGPNLSHEQDCLHFLLLADLLEKPRKLTQYFVLGGATLSRSYELDQKFDGL